MAEEQASTNKNIFLDSDQDGLSDEEEKTYGTNPQVADTDGDGYSDGAEIQSGYNPLKPAPGDRVTPEIKSINTENVSTNPNATNMTEEVTQRISTLVQDADPNNQEVTMEQVKAIVDESLNTKVSTDEFPAVSKDEITIKEQPATTGLSDAQITQIKKEDFADYITGVSYVMSSNSPTPITSATDLTNISTSLSQDFTTGILTQNTSSIRSVLGTEQKIVEQMKSIPVPAELVDTHIEALRIAKYSQNLDELLTQDPNDPIANIANFSKASSFIDYASTFSDDLNEKFNTYGLTYDDSVKNKLTSYGATAPNPDLIQMLFQ
ncbi:MAG: hypothetical protein Q7T51_01190 [Candidatus Moranbacteria bacterium]|nr:hypothetical protein [Candidatus Moranbacteria bacterium]